MSCLSTIRSYNSEYLIRDGGVSRYIHQWDPQSLKLFVKMLENQMNEQIIYEVVDDVSAKDTYQEMYDELVEFEPTYQDMKNDKERNGTTFNELKMKRRRLIKEMRRKSAKIHKKTGLSFGGKDPMGGYVWGYKKTDS